MRICRLARFAANLCLNCIHMIRRDYILRLIEEFAKALARIRALKKDQQLGQASVLTEEEFKRIHRH